MHLQSAESRINGLGLEMKEREARASTAEEEAALLLTQLHQVQEELERHFLKHKEESTAHEKKLAELNSSLAERDKKLKAAEAKLVDSGPEQKKREAEARAKLEAAVAEKQKEVDVSARAAKNAQEEADLLLNQLHQVQEELENYFLKHREAANQVRQLEARWQRMLGRNPGYTEFSDVALLQQSEDGNRTTWLFKDLVAAGQNFPELSVTLDATNKSRRV